MKKFFLFIGTFSVPFFAFASDSSGLVEFQALKEHTINYGRLIQASCDANGCVATAQADTACVVGSCRSYTDECISSAREFSVAAAKSSCESAGGIPNEDVSTYNVLKLPERKYKYTECQATTNIKCTLSSDYAVDRMFSCSYLNKNCSAIAIAEHSQICEQDAADKSLAKAVAACEARGGTPDISTKKITRAAKLPNTGACQAETEIKCTNLKPSKVFSDGSFQD